MDESALFANGFGEATVTSSAPTLLSTLFFSSFLATAVVRLVRGRTTTPVVMNRTTSSAVKALGRRLIRAITDTS